MNDDLISRKALLSGFDVRKVTEYDESGCGVNYKAVPVEAIESAPAVDAEPVRRGRCRMCNIRETGHGVIAFYDVGWEVCINRRSLNYYMVVNHDGSQIDIPIDFCPYCGAKMDKEEKYEHWKDWEAVRKVTLALHHE